ncbi:hypothetical protein HPB48_010358 [Haemaphysalis longicornis]|uniref:Uncharacterized protein n=1 Tax=Haemaphysalis longicornis TaxID=44386 RepID=A0A9J6GKV0_HAELO|nr:hypothetical protein HPB48_010358 [Haemaphysalis longicornis]
MSKATLAARNKSLANRLQSSCSVMRQSLRFYLQAITPHCSDIRTPFWSKKKAVITVGCLFIVAAFLFLALLLHDKRSGITSDSAICLTQSCVLHRHILMEVINQSIDACQDFEEFVCSRWSPGANAGSATSMQAVMMLRWLDRLGMMIGKGTKHLETAKKARDMYASCVATHLPPSYAARDALKAFMAARNLRWPEEPTGEADAFGVLLDLAYNWEVPLWFRVVVLPEDTYHPRTRVLLSLNPQMTQWQAILEEVISIDGVNSYRKYWEGFYNQLADDEVDFHPNETVILHSYTNMKTIFRLFLEKGAHTDQASLQFTLGEARNHLRFRENFTQLFRKHIERHGTFSAKDLLVFAEAHLLGALNTAFSTHTNREVLRHASWLFVQAYAPVAAPYSMLVTMQGSEHRAIAELPRYCASHVEATYQTMINALFTISRLKLSRRPSITEHLGNIVEGVLQGLRNATWLDLKSRQSAIMKVNATKTVLWPPEELLTETGLGELYRFFPQTGLSFGDIWLKTRQAIRNRRAHDPTRSTEVLRARGSYALPLLTYVHALNTVFVSMAALTRPLFYKNGTKAMLYGGLGYSYAKQVLRGIDSNGVSVDAHGRPVASWMSPQSMANLEDRTRCLGISDPSQLTDLAALEVAYEAYRKAVREGEPRLLTNFTETQVFFITMCLAMCSRVGAQSTGHCRKAVAAFRPFYDAFRCPVGLKPYQPASCAFFS